MSPSSRFSKTLNQLRRKPAFHKRLVLILLSVHDLQMLRAHHR
jgi:hypothetical protein